MKRMCLVMFVSVAFFLHVKVNAQQQNENHVNVSPVRAYHVSICSNKTSNLIFPFTIKSIDRGSAAILVQKASGVENILQIKAAEECFKQTNLTVVTEDGSFYSFLVDYTADPPVLNISLQTDTNRFQSTALLTNLSVNKRLTKAIAERVKEQPLFLNKGISEQRMRVALRAIYLNPKTMCFLLRLQNKSFIDFSIGSMRFFVRDRRQAKRTAVQETELHPTYMDSGKTIAGQSGDTLLIAFPPFTIPQSKELVVEISEKSGGRSLQLKVRSRKILRARLLPG